MRGFEIQMINSRERACFTSRSCLTCLVSPACIKKSFGRRPVVVAFSFSGVAGFGARSARLETAAAPRTRMTNCGSLEPSFEQWNFHTGKFMKILRGHTNNVRSEEHTSELQSP